MMAFLAATGRALVAQLPPAIARILVLMLLVGVLTLHVWASARITALELADEKLRTADIMLSEQNKHVLAAVAELTTEVRGYRDDIRDENKALKAKLRQR